MCQVSEFKYVPFLRNSNFSVLIEVHWKDIGIDSSVLRIREQCKYKTDIKKISTSTSKQSFSGKRKSGTDKTNNWTDERNKSICKHWNLFLRKNRTLNTWTWVDQCTNANINIGRSHKRKEEWNNQHRFIDIFNRGELKAMYGKPYKMLTSLTRTTINKVQRKSRLWFKRKSWNRNPSWRC